VRAASPSIVPRFVGDLGDTSVALDEGAFAEHCALLSSEFTKLTAWILVVLTPVLWPTDALLFESQPELLAFFGYWRPPVLALAVITLLGLRFSATVRRNATLFAHIALAGGAAICGVALGHLGELGEVYYPCSYMLSQATVPLLVRPAARVVGNLVVPLAFTLPYGYFHPAYFTSNPYAISLLVFQVLAIVGSVGLGHSLYGLVRGNFARREALAAQAAELARAREKSERLLLNILPLAVATQLKDGAATIAEAHDDVTVLFVDICGFTRLSDGSGAAEVVQMLSTVFLAFDALVELHGVEKIKTIGDAYMVAAGLPEPRADHAQAIADLALDMLAVIRGLCDPAGAPLQVRIGAHCGPVIAGVIGRKKFIYDLWGDTVNTASRMESHGEPGSIQITDELARRLGSAYRCELRGAIAVKGKGEMITHFLLGRAG
jgi:class 3 adenylate cyclase